MDPAHTTSAVTHNPMGDEGVAQLSSRGFVVLKGLVPKEACARARELLDDTFGPRGKSAEAYVHGRGWKLSHYTQARADAHDQAFWDSCEPFLQSNNFYHDMRHPIRSGVGAELVPPALVAAMQTVLRSPVRHAAICPQAV
jgi:hypothetical protein